MPPVDWGSLIYPTTSLFEIAIRGTLVYIAIFIFLRILRRDAGTIGLADLLVVVMIADAAQNALGSKYQSITEGLVLVLTILFWNYAIDFLSYQFPAFRKLVVAAPVLLVRSGRLQRSNLRREMITEDEVMEHLREEGIDDLSEVDKCYLEGDGHISVIKRRKRSKKPIRTR